LIQCRERVESPHPLAAETEFHGHGADEFDRIQHRIQDQRGRELLPQFLQHGAAQRGLTRAHFAGQLHETLPLPNAIKHVVVGLAVFRAEEKEARIGCQFEWRILQPVILQVHADCLAKLARAEKNFPYRPQ
jgi:hypothetical protein